MSTINLPKDSVKTIIDVDNRNVEVSIETAINTLTENNTKEKGTGLRTLYAAPEDYDDSPELDYHYDIAYINKISLQKITQFNPEVKYWSIKFKYYNDLPIEFIVPGYVKFWSQNNRNFVPVEFMKKSDILIDYKGAMVQVVKKTELTDIDLTDQDFYSISVSGNNQNYAGQFYLNGILTTISYNNFLKD